MATFLYGNGSVGRDRPGIVTDWVLPGRRFRRS